MYKNDDSFNNSSTKPEEKLSFDEVKSEQVKPVIEPKEPYKVLVIKKDSFVLQDKKGNGIQIPTPEKYKKAKVGDTIYLQL